MSKYLKLDNQQLNAIKVEMDAAIDTASSLIDADLDFGNKKRYREQVLQISDQLKRIEKTTRKLPSTYLSELLAEGKRLLKQAQNYKSKEQTAMMSAVIAESFSVLSASLVRIENGLAEDVLGVTETINKVRSAQNEVALHPASIFEPEYDLIKLPDLSESFSADEIKEYAKKYRIVYHKELLRWLKGGEISSLKGINGVFHQYFSISKQHKNRCLWWVAQSYVDYLELNELDELKLHAHNFRRLDDVMRELVQNAENGSQKANRESLINSMLFYVGKAPLRTATMDSLVEQLSLHHYFPKPRVHQSGIVPILNQSPAGSLNLDSSSLDSSSEFGDTSSENKAIDVEGVSPNLSDEELAHSQVDQSGSETILADTTVESEDDPLSASHEHDASEQVATVFANMEEIDDLAEPSSRTIKNCDAKGEQEIDAFETSLDAFTTATEEVSSETKNRELKSEQIESLIPDELTDLLQYEVNRDEMEQNHHKGLNESAKTDKELLPDELTDLVEEGLLNMSVSFKNSIRKMRDQRQSKDAKNTKS